MGAACYHRRSSLYFRFIQLRGVKHAIELVRGVYSNPNDKGEVTHFQPPHRIIGTVGLGNIAGVAVAVSIGGGATYWMILAGLLGMASKFCECTLGVKYRRTNEDGRIWRSVLLPISRLKENNDNVVICNWRVCVHDLLHHGISRWRQYVSSESSPRTTRRHWAGE